MQARSFFGLLHFNTRISATISVTATPHCCPLLNALQEDLVNPSLDELSMMTYISYFRTATRQDHEKAGIEVREPSPVTVQPEPEPEPEPPKGNADGGSTLPPWERAADWRVYEGDDLGGRCKIRVYFSTTTSSQVVRTLFIPLPLFISLSLPCT